MEIKVLGIDEFNSFKTKVYNDLEEMKVLLKERSHSKKWMKSTEVRNLLGISHGTLQTLRNNDTLKYSKIRGILYYDIEDVNKLLEANRSK